MCKHQSDLCQSKNKPLQVSHNFPGPLKKESPISVKLFLNITEGELISIYACWPTVFIIN